MESAGVVRTLAEPNLTAISGEVRDIYLRRRISHSDRRNLPNDDLGGIGNCVQTVTYKKFGISLNFTPVVLAEGRISLRVMTEVSEVSAENALTGGVGGTTIPSIKTRRAETTLEIPSGGSMAMAGLIQQQTKQAVNGLPGVDQIPIFGQLFRSQDFINNETELMVLVTPYVVRAVAQKSCHVRTTGSRPPPIPNRHCLPASTVSTASPHALNRLAPTTAILASSLTDIALPDRCKTRTPR